MPVGGDVEGFLAVEEAHDVGGERGVDDGRGDELVHCLVVGGVRGVVDEAGAAGVDAAGEEGHAHGFVVGDALKGADEVGAFEVLEWDCWLAWGLKWWRLGGRVVNFYLAFVRPHVAELVEDFDFAEGTEHALHEAGLSYSLLHAVEA